MNKKRAIFISFIILLILIISGVLFYLNKKGYVKIFGSTTYSQRIESISNSSDWLNHNGYNEVDFTSGGLKLKTNQNPATKQEKIDDTYLSWGSVNGSCAKCSTFSPYRILEDTRTFSLPSDYTKVLLTSIRSDDFIDSIEINGSQIVGKYVDEKYHPDEDITAYINPNSVNKIYFKIKDFGGDVAYYSTVKVYRLVDVPSTNTYSSSGYYITKKFGASDLSSFDRLVLNSENKPANTDIYYEFLPVDDNGQVLTDNSKCASSSKCISKVYRSSNGEINLKDVSGISGWKFFAIRINLKSTNTSVTPSLGGLNVYYTTAMQINEPTISLSASPLTINNGEKSTISWNVSNSTIVSIDRSIGTVNSTGTVQVAPTSSTTYTLTAVGPGGTVSSTVSIVVNKQQEPAPTVSLTASPTTITVGDSSTLTWSSTNATTYSIDNGVNALGSSSGSKEVSPTATTTYTITATGPGGVKTASTTITVNPKPVMTVSLSASPATITAGESATLTIGSSNAKSLSIDNGVGVVTNGTKSVSSSATTTYTLIGTANDNSTKTASVTITVNPKPQQETQTQPAMTVSLTANPTTILVGDSTTLTIGSSNSKSLSINNGVGTVSNGNTKVVSPTTTTTYILTGTANDNSTKTASVTITVNPKPQYRLNFNILLQSKSKTQSKLVKFKVVDASKVLKQSFESTLDANNNGNNLLPTEVKNSLKIYAKASKHLSKKLEKNVTSDTQLNYGKLLAGDLNNDDAINSLDWSLINKFWQQTSDDNDLTGDSIINSLDSSILNANWGKQGDGLVDGINLN